MLILTRKYDQSIVIDTPEGPITIMLVGVERDRAKIGIDAPRCYTILRAELTKRTGDE